MSIVVAAGPELRTARVLLRRWRQTDRERFAEINCNPRVMRYFVRPNTEAESDHLLERIETCFEQRGYGLWAMEPDGHGLAGFVGLWPVPETMPFAPAVEVGWRLAPDFWGEGFATEAAGAAVEFAFGELALGEVVSYTAATNVASQRVMERLGMSTDQAEDFAHPEIEAGHGLAQHVLYRLAAADWRLRAHMLSASAGATPTLPDRKS